MQQGLSTEKLGLPVKPLFFPGIRQQGDFWNGNPKIYNSRRKARELTYNKLLPRDERGRMKAVFLALTASFGEKAFWHIYDLCWRKGILVSMACFGGQMREKRQVGWRRSERNSV